MYLIKHYRDNTALRRSFNALAEKTFGLNFESWYQNGFWTDNYDPYSIVNEGQIVANVSVNRTDMQISGQRKRLIQLGTVMTAEKYRNRGLIRAIMAEIEKDYPDADGMYLFANDTVLDFYPKFGFRRLPEYQYSKSVEQTGSLEMVNLPMDKPENWNILRTAMESSRFHGGCEMLDNPGLLFFYVTQYMGESVFYSQKRNLYVIAERDGEMLTLHNVFAKEPVELDSVIAAFGRDINRVVLGFAPADASGYEKAVLHEADTTLFVKGGAFDSFDTMGLRIPSLSHA